MLGLGKHSAQYKMCKVMVVGAARTGKTSLVRSLNKQPFENRTSTNILEVSDFTLNNRKEIKIYDLGGREEMLPFVHYQNLQCVVILVVNQCTQSLKRIKEQIDFWKNFHLNKILVVSTCFAEEVEDRDAGGKRQMAGREQIDKNNKLDERDIAALGIDRNMFVRISNKTRMGIERVVEALEEMCELQTIVWNVSEPEYCLREWLVSAQENNPIVNLQEAGPFECEHDHVNNFWRDLFVLEKSGWIFTTTKPDGTVSVIDPKLICKLLQELSTIDIEYDSIPGLISEENLEDCVNKVCEGTQRTENLEGFADVIERVLICRRINLREPTGMVPCIILPNLLPKFEGQAGMWSNLNVTERMGVTRKWVILEKYGDEGNVVGLIFSQLIIKMWNEIVDVNLCLRDRFVLRGDDTPEFALELENLKNFMVVSRTDKHEIKLEVFGKCFARLCQLEKEMQSLSVEYSTNLDCSHCEI